MQSILFAASVMMLLVPLEALASTHKIDHLHWSRHTGNKNKGATLAKNTTSCSPYKLEDMYQGESFLNDWDFFSHPDPTRGNVNYQTREDAIRKNLAYVEDDGTTVLAVDDFTDVPVGGNRDSIRISTKKKYNGGLFIADFWKMPHGCSVWPAYWSVGPDWPEGGEIDILEGVHEQATNQYVLHTGKACSLSQDGVQVKTNVIHDQCASSASDNRGCGFSDTDVRSYGTPFNNNAGGVFVHLWNSEGIKMWFFPRGEIPDDIEEKRPDPETWPTPVAFFSSKTCNMEENLYEHTLVLDTTICGDWGGPSYANSGCPGTCAQAVADTSIFKWAKWKVNYIATYQLA